MFYFPQSALRKSLATAFATTTLALVSFALAAQAQTPEWAWVGGSSGANAQSIYGTKGVASPANTPGARVSPATWTDSGGNFWMFGGYTLSDLWEFSPLTREWTWVGGSTQGRQPGNYGALGKPAATNFPGARGGAVTWVDTQGRFWLFGGEGFDSTGAAGLLSDLWMFDPSTLLWTWIGGSSTIGSGQGQPGVYGEQRTPGMGNIPGGREEANSWVDSNGNFWLFGGEGIDASGNLGYLNDIWEYNLSAGEWTWVTGSSTLTCTGPDNAYCTSAASYGMMGTPTLSNTPGSRYSGGAWTDSNGNLWLFGGGTDNAEVQLNDLWEFSPLTTEWTWMGGSDSGVLVNNTATYPGGRAGPTSWTDSNGNLWLFGGLFIKTFEGADFGPYLVNDWLNDLWEFSPANQTWTFWGGGDSVSCVGSTSIYMPPNCTYSSGNYATPGEPDARYLGVGWADSNNDLWLFGGANYNGELNDLWEYAPAGATATPSFNPPAGSYNGVQPVTITSTTANATIYYTLDGTTPTTGSPQYSGPVTLNQSTQTLKAMAFAPGFGPSLTASATYSLTLPQAAKPQISPAGGTFKGPRQITITDTTPGASIYYAINSTATASATRYTGPFTLSSSGYVEAIAAGPDYSSSKEAIVFYSIDSTTTTLTSTSGTPPFALTCSLQAPATAGGPKPTGNMTFTDTTTRRVAGTLPVDAPAIGTIYQFTSNAIANSAGATVSGDFNRDGKLDLAVISGTGVAILLGNGDGTFQPEVDYSIGRFSTLIAAADLNGDGKLDLVLASPPSNGGPDTVSILLGNGDGTFRLPSASTTITDEPVQMVVGDFNGDKKPDLAILTRTQQGAAGVSVLLGNGNGTFQPEVFTTTGTFAANMVAGNFTGGKYDDLVFVQPLTYLSSNGDGTFQAKSLAAAAQLPFSPSLASAADFNGDGNLDLVLSGHAVSTGNNWIAVLLGNGDGTFQYSEQLAQLLGSHFGAYNLLIGHFTSGNALQVAAGDLGSSTTWLFTSDANGVLSQPAIYPEFGDVVTALRGDGNLDFIEPVNSSVVVYAPVLQATASVTLTPAVNTADIAVHTFECFYSGDTNYSGSTSNPVSETFIQALPPLFSLLVGDYPAAQPVQIADASPNATIYYTTDGSDPTPNSIVYSGPITLTQTTKLKAIAAGEYLPSLISEAVYTITDAPQFSSVHSTGAATETVTLVDAIPGAAIYYTLDGTTPSVKSTQYLSPITLTKATTIKAFAAIKGRINSALVTQTFNVSQPATPAVAWAAPKAIQYGTALSSTQLNASSDVTGSFSYSPRPGTVPAAGMHAITVTFTPADRAHFATVSKTVELEVLKRALIVSARLTKVYGAPMPKLSYQLTGFVNGDTAAKDVTGKLVLTTKATQKSVVGNYAITVVTNTLKAANYAFDFARNEITVTKAPLKVTATSFTMPQGGPLPALTYKLSGFVNGDAAKVIQGAPKLTTSATAASNPGKYAITITVGSLKAENYSFDLTGGTLTVQ